MYCNYNGKECGGSYLVEGMFCFWFDLGVGDRRISDETI